MHVCVRVCLRYLFSFRQHFRLFPHKHPAGCQRCGWLNFGGPLGRRSAAPQPGSAAMRRDAVSGSDGGGAAGGARRLPSAAPAHDAFESDANAAALHHHGMGTLGTLGRSPARPTAKRKRPSRRRQVCGGQTAPPGVHDLHQTAGRSGRGGACRRFYKPSLIVKRNIINH